MAGREGEGWGKYLRAVNKSCLHFETPGASDGFIRRQFFFAHFLPRNRARAVRMSTGTQTKTKLQEPTRSHTRSGNVIEISEVSCGPLAWTGWSAGRGKSFPTHSRFQFPISPKTTQPTNRPSPPEKPYIVAVYWSQMDECHFTDIEGL